MVQRRHAEDAFAAQFVRHDLKDDRSRLGHEHPADDHQHDLLLADQRNDAQRCAQGQRPDVAHEHLRRIGVEPQEAQPGRGQRPAEDGDFPGAGDVRHLQILRDDAVAADVAEQGIRHAGDHDRPDGQAVQPVGQVDRVRGADHDERGERHVPAAQRRPHVFQKGDSQRAVESGLRGQPRGRGQGDDGLRGEFLLAAQTGRTLAAKFLVVVQKTDQPEAQRDAQHQPDVGIRQVGQQHGRQTQRKQDQGTAHGRRAGLALVFGRAVLADGLADLQRGQPADQPGPQHERDAERQQRRQQRPKRDVAEDVEHGVRRVQRIQGRVQHYAPSPGSRPGAALGPRRRPSARCPVFMIRPAKDSRGPPRRRRSGAGWFPRSDSPRALCRR